MQITSPALQNVSYPQLRASSQGTTKGAGVTACEAQSRCSNDSAQRPEHKPLSEYRVGQLARGVLQAGTGLVRSTAGFVFSQVMNSREIGAVAPGLKENLLVLAALYNEFQPTQAACGSYGFQCNNTVCIDFNLQCDSFEDCPDGSDEGSDFCTAAKCVELDRNIVCKGFNNHNICISPYWVCDGVSDCDDPKDEGPGVCDQAKCVELRREFRCSNGQCIDIALGCNGIVGDCKDRSDESAELCSTTTTAHTTTALTTTAHTTTAHTTTAHTTTAHTTTAHTTTAHTTTAHTTTAHTTTAHTTTAHTTTAPTTMHAPTTTPTMVPSSTEKAGPTAAYSEDTESSSYGWVAAPVIIATSVLSVALYGGCAYKSYHAFRRDDQASSGIQLLRKALRHPMYFRQAHQPVAATISMQALDIN